jgi:hypothetical protein
VRWRKSRTDPEKCCTFQDEKEATAAKRLAEAHGHQISPAEVYRAILGAPTDHSGVPTLPEWIEDWIDGKREGCQLADWSKGSTCDQ